MPDGPYRIAATAEAQRQMRKLDKPIAKRINAAVEALASEPRPAGCKRLSGQDHRHLWRIKVAAYRVVYTIDDQGRVVVVAVVAHRSKVYKNLPGVVKPAEGGGGGG